MPVPGFLAGVHATHAKFGVLPWAELSAPAIRYARAGFAVPEFIVAAARKHAARFAEGQSLWMKEGRFLVVRDAQGNCAWGTHSINTSTAFGAGIIVDGVYAAYALNRAHVHGTGATAPGITSSYALYQAGRPRIICGSPGFGFVHGPYQVGTSIVEWGASPARAIDDPRFSIPLPDGTVLFERDYDDSVLAMLQKRGIKHVRGRASEATGLVDALVVADDGTLHVAQDPRRDGFAMAQ